MSTFHLIVPLKEAVDHGEHAWLEGHGIVVEPSVLGRYPSRAEFLQVLQTAGSLKWRVNDHPDEITVDLVDEVHKTHAAMTLDLSSSSGSGCRLVYRGNDGHVLPLVRALEPICGGPFLIVVNSETPVLARTWTGLSTP